MWKGESTEGHEGGLDQLWWKWWPTFKWGRNSVSWPYVSTRETGKCNLPVYPEGRQTDFDENIAVSATIHLFIQHIYLAHVVVRKSTRMISALFTSVLWEAVWCDGKSLNLNQVDLCLDINSVYTCNRIWHKLLGISELQLFQLKDGNNAYLGKVVFYLYILGDFNVLIYLKHKHSISSMYLPTTYGYIYTCYLLLSLPFLLLPLLLPPPLLLLPLLLCIQYTFYGLSITLWIILWEQLCSNSFTWMKRIAPWMQVCIL